MSSCSGIFHVFTDTGQLGCNCLTCIFQIQCEDRFLGKGRAVFPDLVDEVIFVNDFSVFLGCDGLVILSLTHGNYTSVKSECAVFR